MATNKCAHCGMSIALVTYGPYGKTPRKEWRHTGNRWQSTDCKTPAPVIHGSTSGDYAHRENLKRLKDALKQLEGYKRDDLSDYNVDSVDRAEHLIRDVLHRIEHQNMR